MFIYGEPRRVKELTYQWNKTRQVRKKGEYNMRHYPRWKNAGIKPDSPEDLREEIKDAERTKRLGLVPKGTIMGGLLLNMPVEDKVWIIEEAYRRNIYVSWLGTEIVKLGMEAYKLINDIPETFMGVPFEKGAKRGQSGG